MPLIASPTFEETMVPADEGISLRLRKTELPDEQVSAEVIITHGLGEHSRRYEHVAGGLMNQGVRVWAYDLRGHGRSGGRRGDATRYGLFLDDLARVVELVTRTRRPLFLLGHSFGGQITVRFLQERKPPVCGAVICSPWLRLAFQPSWWRLGLARLALMICPGLAHSTPTTLANLSRDLEYLLAMPDIELTHKRLSPRLFFGIEAAGQKALTEARSLQLPLLLIHGSDDHVTCAQATQEFYGRLGSRDKTLSMYAEARHETHNDLCRDRVLSEICNWISDRIPC